jgi:hypothetical protein
MSEIADLIGRHGGRSVGDDEAIVLRRRSRKLATVGIPAAGLDVILSQATKASGGGIVTGFWTGREAARSTRRPRHGRRPMPSSPTSRPGRSGRSSMSRHRPASSTSRSYEGVAPSKTRAAPGIRGLFRFWIRIPSRLPGRRSRSG